MINTQDVEVGMVDAINLEMIPQGVRCDILRRWLMQKILVLQNTNTQRFVYYLYLSQQLVADLNSLMGHLTKLTVKEVIGYTHHRVVSNIDIDVCLPHIYNAICAKIGIIQETMQVVVAEHPHHQNGIMKLQGQIALLQEYKRLIEHVLI